MHPDQRRLHNAGYKTKRYTPYHFQVFIKVGAIVNIVNVWPTARKILKEYEKGPAHIYEPRRLIEAVENEVRIRIPIPQPRTEADDLREGGLEYIKKHAK